MLPIFLFFQIATAITQPDPTPKFEAQTIDPNISIGYGIATGDVDGDGKPDILLADKKQFVWYRNGDWKRFVMVDNLTEQDNVCIAARDVNGDGKVEVAVGAQWNPGETTDSTKSGSVHYLLRPVDPTQPWKPIQLHHEPTVHRMRWVKSSDGKFYLVVVPLHGRGNKNGEGQGVNIMAYKYPGSAEGTWETTIIDNSMHLTHNIAPEERSGKETDIYVAGKEGVRLLAGFKGNAGTAQKVSGIELPAGEVRIGNFGNKKFIATIEPMHGTTVAVYMPAQTPTRKVLDDQFKEGHALATADFLGTGVDQVVAGWRVPNAENKVGIKLFVAKDKSGKEWQTYWIDDNTLATEDLQVIDLNGDGKKDIIAAGRSSKNLKIYWNRN